jgi:hypothetical protein
VNCRNDESIELIGRTCIYGQSIRIPEINEIIRNVSFVVFFKHLNEELTIAVRFGHKEAFSKMRWITV